MSLQDQVIAKALDRLHTDLAGYRKPCRWHYDGKTDIYSCCHIELKGRTVIDATGMAK